MPQPDPHAVWDRADHEDKNRHAKVVRLVSALVSEGVSHNDPTWNESPEALEEFWTNLASKYGINYPSQTTRKQTLTELRHYIMAKR